jgi:IS1 family transposase
MLALPKPVRHNPLTMNRLDAKTRAHVLNCLIEGCSIRSTVRMTGVSKKAVSRLLVEAGAVAAAYQDRVMRNLTSRRIQVDEMWTFNYCKDKNLTDEIRAKVPGAGSVWLWVAMDADTKVVPCAMIGLRNAGDAFQFIDDLASRLKNRVQLTTDGHRPYLEAVDGAFGGKVDYAQLVKLYGNDADAERRYSPAECIGAIPTVISGHPDPAHISTSFVERQNWTVRTTMRRYTRLSNGFSRKIENHMAAVALNYFAYNFIKIHRSLRMTPAMAAGVVTRLMDVNDLVNLLIESEAEKAA